MNIKFNGVKVQAIDVTPLEMLKLNFGMIKEIDVAEGEFSDFGWVFFRINAGEDMEGYRKEYDLIRQKLVKRGRSVDSFEEAVGCDGCIDQRGPYALIKGKRRGRRIKRIISVENL